MTKSEIQINRRLPRRLEAEGHAEKILQVLATRPVKLRSESEWDVPLLPFSAELSQALAKARRQRQIRIGFDAVAEKLALEEKGLALLNQKAASDQGRRISRLLLFSNDGASRLYRHIEQIIREHSGRIMGCMVDADSKTLGRSVTGRDSQIKVLLVEHKDAVAEVLLSLIV